MGAGRASTKGWFSFWMLLVACGAAVLLVAPAGLILAGQGRAGAVAAVSTVATAAALGILASAILLRKRVNTRTIRVRIGVSFVFMAILPAVGISAGSAVLGYVDGRQRAVSHLESVVSLKELELGTWSQALQDVLLAALNEEYATERASVVLDLANTHKYSDYYSRAMRARLQLRLAQSPQIMELMLVDRLGHVALSTDATHEGQVIAGQPFFNAALSGPYLQLPYATPSDAPWLSAPWVIAARPVLDAQGQVLGVAAVRVTPERLDAILGDHTTIGTTGKLYLTDAQGNRLARGVAAAQAVAAGTATGIRIEERVGRPGIYRDQRGEWVFGYYRLVSDAGGVLAVEQDVTEALRVVSTTLAVNAAISVLAVLLASIAALMLARSIARPLVDLADTATQIATGDLERAAPVQRDDEVGTLAVAFNAMTAQLRDSIVHLEQRVAERTRALQEAMRSERRRALQLETSAQVSREITSILTNEELLSRVVALIKDTFGYYHVSIYLLEGDELVLRATSREVRPRVQRSRLDTMSLNTEAVRANTAILSNDVSQDPRYLLDEHLPNARSELVIPLRLGDEAMGTLDVMSTQLNGFTAEDALVFQSLGDQVAVAIENARLYELSQELAVVEERNRLARDLHDSVIQSLYSLNLLTEGWRRLISAGEHDQLDSYLDRVGHITQQAVREMRLLVHELRPPALEEEGLLGALHLRLGAVESRTGIETRVVAEELVDLPAPVEEGLYWIAQEALNNALKHSGATQVTARLHLENGFAVLQISDNGCGFELGSTGCQGGVGLTSMAERAQALGGKLTINTAKGAGTMVQARVPVGPGEAEP